MAGVKLAALTVGFALTLALTIGSGDSAAAEFSAEVTALPFPPDASEVEFVAWSKDIDYKSKSPLKSLAAFYLNNMADRGWKHKKSAAEIDDDSIVLTFKHGKAEVELDLSQWSKEVHVSIDCTGLKFRDTDDPAKLAAAGIPVPRAALFLQKELPLPTGVKDVQYAGDGCTVKSSMKLQEAFDYFTGLVKGKGFRESRRPIISDKRRYTEFKKGTVELSVNVFTHKVGSRIVLTYEDQRKEETVPPLPAVVSLPLENPGNANKSAAGETPAAPTGKTPAGKTSIDVTSNKGSVTVKYGDKKYTFPNVACYKTKDSGSYTTAVVFSAKPIPFSKMQSAVSKEDDFSLGDLYEFDLPNHLVLQLGKNLNFSLSVPGVGIGHGIENSTNEMKVEAGRVRGTFTMSPEEILDRQLSFTASIDAAVITPNTRITRPSKPAN